MEIEGSQQRKGPIKAVIPSIIVYWGKVKTTKTTAHTLSDLHEPGAYFLIGPH